MQKSIKVRKLDKRLSTKRDEWISRIFKTGESMEDIGKMFRLSTEQIYYVLKLKKVKSENP